MGAPDRYTPVTQRPTFRKDLLEMVVSVLVMSFGVVLTVKARAGSEGGRMFGSVTNEDIAAALAEEGVTVDKKKIEIKESIREFGEVEVTVRVYPEITAKLRLTVVRA